MYITDIGPDAGKPDWKVLKNFLLKEGHLKKDLVVMLARQSIEIMSKLDYWFIYLEKEPNLCKIGEPIVIVGDIHGQYHDLCHMLEKAGPPQDINYLFLGDYVDRGIFGVEVLILLMAIKICHPKNVILLRGNHESRNMTENFTFREEAI